MIDEKLQAALKYWTVMFTQRSFNVHSMFILKTRKCQISTYRCRTDCFKYSFFPSALSEWFKLDESIRNSESISIFKNKLLSFIRPAQSSIFNIFDPVGIKFLTRLRLDFSHLNEH